MKFLGLYLILRMRRKIGIVMEFPGDNGFAKGLPLKS
jgi:hypothetical protein